MKDFRRRAGPLGAPEQAVGDPRLGIGLGSVGKWEQVYREEDVEVLQRVARRLAEPVVEGSAPGSADLIEHTVEDAPALLVLIEALIEKMPQETAALRDAPAEGVAETRRWVLG